MNTVLSSVTISGVKKSSAKIIGFTLRGVVAQDNIAEWDFSRLGRYKKIVNEYSTRDTIRLQLFDHDGEAPLLYCSGDVGLDEATLSKADTGEYLISAKIGFELDYNRVLFEGIMAGPEKYYKAELISMGELPVYYPEPEAGSEPTEDSDTDTGTDTGDREYTLGCKK